MKPEYEWLVGKSVTRVVFDPPERWLFMIDDNDYLAVACPWHIIAGERISLANGDHGRKYGLPSPIDAVARANAVLAEHKIESISLDEASADLTVRFSGAVVLRTFNITTGFESWELVRSDGLLLIGQGHGEVVVFPPRQ